jgi:hypothetical protein
VPEQRCAGLCPSFFVSLQPTLHPEKLAVKIYSIT